MFAMPSLDCSLHFRVTFTDREENQLYRAIPGSCAFAHGCLNMLCTRLGLLGTVTIRSGSFIKRTASLLLGLGEGAPTRADEKLKKLSMDGFLASMPAVAIAIERWPLRGINRRPTSDVVLR